MQLSEHLDGTMIQAPVASSTANQTSASIDMAGYTGAMFVANIGTAGTGAVATLQIQGGASTTGFTNLSGASAASTGGADDGYLAVDIARNVGDYRYLRATLSLSTTEGIETGGIMAYQYGSHNIPTTWSSTTTVATLTKDQSPTT